MEKMACALSANTCCYSSTSKGLLRHKLYKNQQQQRSFNCFKIRASADEEEDCNVEECAPDKEVGKVSMEWLAGEKTKVAGTYPPRKPGWTGYVEKDTAGQTNIYSVEPAVYVAESAFSSGSAGSSADGSDNAPARAAGIAFVCVAAISLIAFEVGKFRSPVQTAEYSGPSLSYYINKFKPPELIEVSLPAEAETSSPAEPESSAPEIVDIQVESTGPESSAAEIVDVQVEPTGPESSAAEIVDVQVEPTGAESSAAEIVDVEVELTEPAVP